MSKILKVGLSLLVLLLALLALVLVRLVTLDPNDYKDWITSRFQEQTGHALSLGGNITLSIYPWLGIGVEQVSVANQAGFGEQPLLQAEAAQVRVKLLPVLRQRYEIDTVQLRGVSVNLVVNEEGTGNWSDLVGDSPAGDGAGEDGPGLPLTRFIVGGVDVSNVSLHYEDRRNGAYYGIENLTFTIGELVYGTPIDLAMTLDAVANQPDLAAGIELSGTVNYDLDNRRYALSPLTVNARLSGAGLPEGGTVLEFSTAMDADLAEDTLVISELRATGLDASLMASLQGQQISTGRPLYQGQVNLTGNDLADLFRVAGVGDLAGRLMQLNDRSFSLIADGSFRGGAQGDVVIPELAASLLGADLKASLRITDLDSASPNAQGRLSASGPDLPLVVEVLGQMSGGADALLTRASREMRQVPDRQFNVDLEFNTENSGATVSVPTLQAQLLGASVNGELRATGIDTDTPTVAGVFEAAGSDLPLLMQLGALSQGGADSSLSEIAARLRETGDGNFQVNARFDVNLEDGDIAIPVLSAQSLGWRIEGQMDARGMDARNGSVNGSLALESSDAAPLLAALGQAELAAIVESVSVQVGVSGSRTDLAVSPLNASVVVSGPRIAGSTATLELNTDVRVNLDRESLVLESFSASGLGLDASGTAEVERLFDEPAYQGQVELAEFDLRAFLQQLNQQVPLTRDPAVLRRVGIVTRFDGSTDRLALEGLNLILDETTLLGSLSLGSFSEPSGEFTLEIDRLNVDRYLAPEQAGATSSTDSEATELPIEALRNLTLLGDLRVGELTVAGLTMQGVAVTLNATDGDINLAPLAAELYQGSFEGVIELSVAGEEPEVRLETNLRSIDLESLLFDLLDATYLTGEGNVQLSLEGSGMNTDALKQTLSGNGRLEIEDGVLSGVDVASVLRQLETMIRSRQPGGLQRGTQTAFDSFSGTIVIDDGIVRSNDILIQSPGFRVTGRGTLLNLADNSINFNLTTDVDRSTASLASDQYDLGGYSLPIACTGSLDSPRCIPDTEEILRARLQREVQDRVLDLLNRSTDADSDGNGQGTDPATQQDEPEQPAQPPQEDSPDIRDQIINRAIDRLLN